MASESSDDEPDLLSSSGKWQPLVPRLPGGTTLDMQVLQAYAMGEYMERYNAAVSRRRDLEFQLPFLFQELDREAEQARRQWSNVVQAVAALKTQMGKVERLIGSIERLGNITPRR